MLFLLFSGQAVSEPAKILIIPFQNATDNSKNDSLVTAVPEILTVCFSNYVEQIIVLDRRSLDANLAEQSLSWEKFVAQNSNQSIGQVIGANFILTGSMVLQDSQVQLQALLFDVATTELRHLVSSSIDSSNLVNSLCANISKPLVSSLNEKVSLATNFQIEEMPEKQQLLIEGLNHYYNGEYAQSFAPFLKLVKNYPDDAIFHYWLAQSFYSAGLDDFAKIQLQDFINRFKSSSRILKVQTLLNNLQSKRLTNENK